MAQNNLMQQVIKIAPSFGARASRYFAWIVKRARRLEEACTDGSVVKAEAFVELFSHLVFHLQGTKKFIVVAMSTSRRIPTLRATKVVLLYTNRYFCSDNPVSFRPSNTNFYHFCFPRRHPHPSHSRLCQLRQGRSRYGGTSTYEGRAEGYLGHA